MDKSNLYYIVMVGTNGRVQTSDNLPLTIKQEAVDDTLDRCKEIAELKGYTMYEFEAITIEEYERIFTEAEVW
jgi:hypothetical protein